MRHVPESKHGTRYAYIYYKCRCDKCRAANTHYLKFARMKRAWRLRQDPTLAVHGRRATYINWECRCEPCTAAHSAGCREYAAAKRSQQKERPDGSGEGN